MRLLYQKIHVKWCIIYSYIITDVRFCNDCFESSDNMENVMHRITSIVWEPRPWLNVELAKDIALVPYLLHKNHGCEVTLVTGPGEVYTYLKYLEGITLVILKDCSIESKLEYIDANHENIDLMMFYGVTSHDLYMDEHLRKIGAKCMRTCALDMNIEYADRLVFYKEPFYGYFNDMDLMWQCGAVMTEFLNKKWDWQIECERNGYYDLIRQTSDVEYIPIQKRDNTILYVGRVTEEQKCIKMLLEAFSKIADKIEDWQLKLVGPIDESINEYLETYIEYNLEIAERITFTGVIEDRELLHEEYQRAKIFASTSDMEGGVPNSMAEALCSGCVMAITQIEGYKDCIGDDEAGLSVPVGDTEGFSVMLLRLCTEMDLEQMSKASYSRGKRFFNMEKIVEEIYGKLCDRGF